MTEMSHQLPWILVFFYVKRSALINDIDSDNNI